MTKLEGGDPANPENTFSMNQHLCRGWVPVEEPTVGPLSSLYSENIKKSQLLPPPLSGGRGAGRAHQRANPEKPGDEGVRRWGGAGVFKC